MTDHDFAVMILITLMCILTIIAIVSVWILIKEFVENINQYRRYKRMMKRSRAH